jgi:DNA-binding beta-propeller fold protein YncE
MRVTRTVALYMCAFLAALFVAGAANASAAPPFMKSWGYGVSTGAALFETCTTSCLAGRNPGVGPGGALWYPKGAAVSPTTGDVFVTNELRRVDVYSSSGMFLRAFGGGVAGGSGPQVCTTSCSSGSSGTGPGELAIPWGIAVDGSGNVVVSEFTNDRVSVFTEAGAFVRTFGSGVLDRPRGVALNGSGNVLVVDAANSRVVEFTLAGAYLGTFGTDGTGAGQLRNPNGIGVGPSGNVMVSDSDNHRVDEFSPTGSFIRTFGYGVNTGAAAPEVCTSSCRAGVPGAGAGQLTGPGGLAVDANGRLLVSDGANARINMYTETGSFLESFGSEGSGAGEFLGPVGLALDGEGYAIVADTYNHRVAVFDVAGLRAPTGLTVVPEAWQVTLTWNPVDNAESYNIYVDGQLYQQVGSDLLSTSVFAVAGQPTRYQVSAFVQGVESARSASVTATATEFPQWDPEPPTDPTDPAVAAPARPKLKKLTGTTVTVTLPKAKRGTVLVLYVRAAHGPRVKVKGKPDRTGKLTVKRLKRNTSYQLTLVAVRGGQRSAASAPLKVKTKRR